MSNDSYLLLYTEPPTRTVFARHRPPGRLIFASDVVSDEDRAVYDQCVQLPEVTQVAETLELLEQIKADHLVVQTEYGLLPGALLAGRRGLPAPSLEAAELCTNKWLFRNVCRKNGVTVPEFALAESVADVRRFAQQFPLVLKPIASTLQRLVAKVENVEEMESHVGLLKRCMPEAPDVLRYLNFARLAGLDPGCDPNRHFLVEEFIDAPPLETDGLIFGDTIDYFGATEQIHTPAPHFFIEGYLFPADQCDHKTLKSTSEAVIRAIGLTDAGFSIEFRGSHIIEVNGRLGEDEGFPDLYAAALGKFPIIKWIERDASPSQAKGHHAVAYQCWYQGGHVKAVPDSDGAVVLIKAGQKLYKPPHPEIWPHLAYALEAHPTSSREAYKAARETVDKLRFDISCES